MINSFNKTDDFIKMMNLLNKTDDFTRLSSWGYQMALVGSSLMRSKDPASMISKMKIAGATA